MRKRKKKEVYPACARLECKANKRGDCVCLTDNDFGKRECPFFKEKEHDETGTSAIQKD